MSQNDPDGHINVVDVGTPPEQIATCVDELQANTELQTLQTSHAGTVPHPPAMSAQNPVGHVEIAVGLTTPPTQGKNCVSLMHATEDTVPQVPQTPIAVCTLADTMKVKQIVIFIEWQIETAK